MAQELTTDRLAYLRGIALDLITGTRTHKAYEVGTALEEVIDHVEAADSEAEAAVEEKETAEAEKEWYQTRNENLEEAFKKAGDLGAQLVALGAAVKKE